MRDYEIISSDKVAEIENFGEFFAAQKIKEIKIAECLSMPLTFLERTKEIKQPSPGMAICDTCRKEYPKGTGTGMYFNDNILKHICDDCWDFISR